MKWGANFTGFYETMMIGSLANISGIKYVNHRFYLNAITTFEYYQNRFSFIHLYDAAYLFNLTVSPLNSTLVFSRKVLIDRKFIY